MAVRIRLARFGCRNRPFYRIIAADSTSRRDGKQLEVLGYYDPLSGQDGEKKMSIKSDRVKYWLSVGAQPSVPVQRILFRSRLLPLPSMHAMVGKGTPCEITPIDPLSGCSMSLKMAADAFDLESTGDGRL